MRIVQGPAADPPDRTPSTVALGAFDGIHLGHRAILGAAVSAARAAGRRAVACTFDRHPLEILQPGRAPRPISTLDERLGLIAATGIDEAVVLAFTIELASVEPEAFVKDVLLTRLAAREVVVGVDHRFGRGARGDAALLRRLGERLGFTVRVVPPLLVDGIPVSSTAIRSALAEGDLEAATRLLGRAYVVGGRVVSGQGRGRRLGFPTANVEPDRPLLIPGGVYAARVGLAEAEQARLGPAEHPAVVNIGVRPTFGETTVAIEAHLLDFEGDLYGWTVRLSFVARLREERRFPSVEALIAQVTADVAETRRRL